MTDILKNWDELTPEQRELLLLMLEEQGVDVDAAAILPAERPDGRAPLSYAQQRLWFLDQLTPGSPMYNIPSAVRLTGPLNVTALERALQEVVRRHEILRTTYASQGDEPLQVIHEHVDFPLRMIDVTVGPQADRPLEDVIACMVQEEARRPFDLENGPVIRATLLRVSAEEHVLLFNMHHIASDGWSVGVLIQEIAALYGAAVEGRPGALPPLPLQYADFATWQRRYLQGDRLEEQLAYWRDRLTGSPALLELPTDRPRPAVQSSRGALQSFELTASLSDAVRRLAHEEETTLFTVLLAAFQLWLHRHSGQDDIPVGTPVANRTRAELEPLIGFFVNTLVIRTDFSGDPDFRQLIRQVRGLVVEAQAHQDVPFEMLVETLKPQRDMSYTPLFQAMFSLQQAGAGRVSLPGITLSALHAHSGTAKFDLLLTMSDAAEGLAGSLEYNSDLFDGPTISRMVVHLQTLLERAVSDPDRPVNALPILTPAEEQLILRNWNQTATPLDTDSTLAARFEVQAALTPDAVAVLAPFAGATSYETLEQITYGELNGRANQLAHVLRTHGVGPEGIVGLAVERSVNLIVGLMAILKAGGAYLPLDPAYPADRLAFMLNDSGARVLLTQEAVLADRPSLAGAGATVIRLDTDLVALSGAPTTNPPPSAGPDNLAYLIYTSGSTGRPKAVMVQHRTALNLAGALHQVAYAHSNLNRPLRISLNAPLAFDASVQQLVMLTQGHTLVVIPQDIRGDADALLSFIRTHRLDQLDCVPSQLKLLLNAGFLDENATWTPSIVFPGGEAIDDATWHALAAAPNTDFFNMYGPTECTVDSTTACARLAPDRATIGGPLANVRAYVLDRRLQPAPIGVPGELFIAGAGVGRGYLNRPELTAERFLPDPFAATGGERMYRTGDLVRWLPDGTIAFLGRVDFQVKVRGFRIELGEIEETLHTHGAVREVVVMARDDAPGGGSGGKRLVAYIVAQNYAAPPTVAELRRHILATLPEYMTPAAFVLLDAMPLTPNAKIDRGALPEPDASRADSGRDFVAPRTPTEEVLAGIWGSLLGVPRVGAEDNFFELGGHSLSATQLVSRMREAFGVDIKLRSLFETPTVAGLAEVIEAARPQAAGIITPRILPIPREAGEDGTARLPLSFAQQRLWFLDQLEPGSVLYNIPAAVRLTGRLDATAMERAINEIVRRHEALRTTFHAQNGVAAQMIAPALTLPLPRTDLTDLPPDSVEIEVGRLAAEEARRSFDLATGPLLRCQLLRLAEDRHVMLLTIHHIVSDGWSTGVIVRELAALYAGYASDGAVVPHLAPLPIQYADYAAWQRDWLQGDILQAQLDYWRDRLAGAPPLLELPTDRPRPAVQSYRGTNETFALPAELSGRLAALGQREGVTLFMTLLGAFQVLLYRYTGQSDICVGTPIANRTRAETEALIGFFANTLVLRADLGGRTSFREVLRRVREAALGAYAHQDIPFETVVDSVRAHRDMSHSPLFQVMFVLQNASEESFALPGLTLESMPVHSGATPFDLTLVMAETPDGLHASFEYNPDLFDPQTIRAMATHFETLAGSLVANPEQPISELSILPAAERERVLWEWNQTEHPFPADRCVHELFEDAAAANPHAEAVRFITAVGDDATATLSYEELNRRANAVAHRLALLGVGPETLVGLAVDKSPELIVGILGVMKAGGAYLPLDPTYPLDRLAYMIEDSGIRVLLTQQRVADDLGPQLGDAHLTMLVLDSAVEVVAGTLKANPARRVSPLNLVYAIYTSGSTGRPKGTLLQHRGLSSFINAYRRVCDLGPGDRVLQFSSPNFDASVAEIFTCLLSGATLVLAPRDLLLSDTALPILLREQRINWSIIPPAMLALISAENLPDLRMLESGGEALPVEVARRWWTGRRLFNGYGPTEATIGPTLYEITDITTEQNVVSIGRPVDNNRCYVLDPEAQPTPIGVPGELFIGGIGMARGYLGRPDLTAERFLPDPYSPEPGARMYRTGDLVRFRRNGNIDFLGRIDLQVKVRGFRIELGEIEEVLREHRGLRDVAVSARDDGRGSKRLVAFFVPVDAANAPTVAEMRSFCAQKLPDYMAPALFVMLETLPLSPSGKLDRKALPAPEAVESLEAGGEYVAATTPAEQTLTDIWQQVLGVERIGVNDSFFDLGGDSILSIQVIARANQAGLSLTPKQLFQAPTIAQLAALAGTAVTSQAEQGPVAGEIVLTPVMRRFFELELANRNHWNQSVLLATRQPLEEAALAAAVRALMVQHDALRLRFTHEVGGWRAHHAAPGDTGDTPFTCVDLSALSEPEAITTLEAHATVMQSSLDIVAGPLLRVVYYRFRSGLRGRLLLVIHHLAVDGVSWRILLEDLQAAYEQHQRGKQITLPAKTTSFRAWSEALALHAQSPEVLAGLDAWLSMGNAWVAPLPVDKAGGAEDNAEDSIAQVVVGLDEEETRALLADVPAVYGTEINDLLLTALAEAWESWTGVPAVRVHLEGHGREDIGATVDVSRTVGWFTSLYPVVVELPIGAGPGEAIQTVKEQLRAIPQRGLSYGLLRYLAEDADVREAMAALPEPELTFNYLGQFDQALGEGSQLAPAQESAGLDRSPGSLRTHLLDITGAIAGKRLNMAWSYSRNIHEQSTIERVAQTYIEALRALIAHCHSAEAGGYTPSDFPLAQLDQEQLDKVLKKTKAR